MLKNEQYEELAERFYKETGLLAPGKSVPPEIATQDYCDRRDRAWESFCAAWGRFYEQMPMTKGAVMYVKMPNQPDYEITDRECLIVILYDRAFEAEIKQVEYRVNEKWRQFVASTACPAKFRVEIKSGFSNGLGRPWNWNGWGNPLATATLLDLSGIPDLIEAEPRKATYSDDDLSFMAIRVVEKLVRHMEKPERWSDRFYDFFQECVEAKRDLNENMGMLDEEGLSLVRDSIGVAVLKEVFDSVREDV